MVNKELGARHLATELTHRISLLRYWRALVAIPVLAITSSIGFSLPSTATDVEPDEADSIVSTAVGVEELEESNEYVLSDATEDDVPTTDDPVPIAENEALSNDENSAVDLTSENSSDNSGAEDTVDEDLDIGRDEFADDALVTTPSDTDTSDTELGKESVPEPNQNQGMLTVASEDSERDTSEARTGFECTKDTAYNISGSGDVYKVRKGMSAKKISQLGGSPSSANMLAIGLGGSPTYAANRLKENGYSNIAVIYQYDANGWKKVHTHKTKLQGTLVAGAVNFKTQKYIYGGYEPYTMASGATGTRFKAFSYKDKKIQTLGWAHVSDSQFGSNNGDIAFDDHGNLYIIHGTGQQVRIISVNEATLLNGDGNELETTISKKFAVDKVKNVNGAAFTSDGALLVSDYNKVVKYTALGEFLEEVGDTGGSSTDLATCSSPSTLTLHKIIDGRVEEDHQFKLTLNDFEASTVTTGTNDGLQTEQVGPFPAYAGTYAFSEAMADGSVSAFSKYTKSWICTDETNETISQGEGDSGTVQILKSHGKYVTCTFTNVGVRPVAVEVSKKLIDESGNALSGADLLSGWDFSAVFDEGVAVTPDQQTQTTGANGKVSWTAKLNAPTATTSVTLGEDVESVAGYKFSSFVCTVTEPGKDPVEKEFTEATGNTVADLPGGSAVSCEVTNQRKPGSVSWLKVDGTSDEALAGSVWTLTKPDGTSVDVEDCTGEPCVGLDENPEPGAFTVTGLAWGDYTLKEDSAPSGYELDKTEHPFTIDGANLAVSFKKAFKNTRILGSVTWSKVDDSTTAVLLGGSTWTLTKPDGTSVDVEDCTGEPCVGWDKDPAPGVFKVEDLAWGEYTLKEKSAPLGYKLDKTDHPFTIDGANLAASFESAFVNQKVDGPGLPLTGGLGSHVFILGGGLLLALAGGATAVAMRRRTA